MCATAIHAAEPVASLSDQAINTVTELVRSAQAADTNKIQSLLFVAPNGTQTRHQATVKSVVAMFKGIDLKTLAMTPPQHFPTRNSVIISITAPVRLDLEFEIVHTTPPSLLLKSIHP